MASINERIVSALSYLTFGIFGIIWVIYVNILRKPMTRFATFNVFQSVAISIILIILGIGYDLFCTLRELITGVRFFNSFELFFFGTPVYFGYSISSLLVAVLIFYLVVLSLLGKRPFIPVLTKSIESLGGV